MLKCLMAWRALNGTGILACASFVSHWLVNLHAILVHLRRIFFVIGLNLERAELKRLVLSMTFSVGMVSSRHAIVIKWSVDWCVHLAHCPIYVYFNDFSRIILNFVLRFILWNSGFIISDNVICRLWSLSFIPTEVESIDKKENRDFMLKCC